MMRNRFILSALILMTAACTLLISTPSFACPKDAPDGFVAVPNQAERTYNDKDKNVVIVVKCTTVKKPEDILSSLKAMGDVHTVNKTVSFVDVTKGAMRIYVDAKTEMTQVAAVSKSPEALEQASPAILKFLERN